MLLYALLSEAVWLLSNRYHRRRRQLSPSTHVALAMLAMDILTREHRVVQ
jgi:hypothetical protein